MNESTNGTNVPAVVDDGFDRPGDDNRLIRGVIARFPDGTWKDADGNPIPPNTRYVAWATGECLQRWQDKRAVETILKKPGAPLPDIEELNAKIPQAEWEKGIDGGLRPPWARQVLVYLIDPQTGAEMTFISGTVGAAIAVEGLRNKTRNMRMLRGNRVVPIVTLGSKLMQTRFGSRLRPEFVIQDWRGLDAPAAITGPQQPAISHEVGTKVEPPSLKEELNDELPY